MNKPVALIILDGFGCNESCNGNAVALAHTPNLDYLYENYPHTLIDASGESVGLPDGQMGNSEVGHLNIGSGRIVFQELTRISNEIKNGKFFENECINQMFDKCIKEGSTLHLMGLLSDGGVHSHIEHLKALIKMSCQKGISSVKIHVILDGRDTPPSSGKEFVQELTEYIKGYANVEIASISGRYYTMDRDNRWDRVKMAYDTIALAQGEEFQAPLDYISKSYDDNIYDEFIKPGKLKDYKGLDENDGILCFNFRPDRAREITRAMTDNDFTEFDNRITVNNFVSMTQYDSKFKNVKVAYMPEPLSNTLGEYVSNLGLSQLRIAETEKYAHVTFFFNGGREEQYKNENRILIPSPKVTTYDLQPEMSARLVTDALINDLEDDPKNMIILNYANPDMVGHTGDLKATIKAIETVDECLLKVVNKILKLDGSIIITADHGNSEKMYDENGGPYTAHTTNKVPFILVSNKYQKNELKKNGKLCDFAPTILELMDLKVPDEMTGISLIKKMEV